MSQLVISFIDFDFYDYFFRYQNKHNYQNIPYPQNRPTNNKDNQCNITLPKIRVKNFFPIKFSRII